MLITSLSTSMQIASLVFLHAGRITVCLNADHISFPLNVNNISSCLNADYLSVLMLITPVFMQITFLS